jgi:hypothetical protein
MTEKYVLNSNRVKIAPEFVTVSKHLFWNSPFCRWHSFSCSRNSLFLWDRKVQRRIDKSPPLASINIQVNQPPSSYHLSRNFILTIQSHLLSGLQSLLFPSEPWTTILCISSHYPTRAARSVHFILLDVTMSRDEYKLWNSWSLDFLQFFDNPFPSRLRKELWVFIGGLGHEGPWRFSNTPVNVLPHNEFFRKKFFLWKLDFRLE